MRTLFLSVFMLICSLSCFAQGRGSMLIDGIVSTFDTLEHRRIGPGMTYTKVHFPNIGTRRYMMLMNVIEIDMTNPYNSHSSYIAFDEFYKAQNQIKEYQRQKQAGKNPVATMMGGAFVQINSTDPAHPAWEVSGGMVSDGRLLLNPTGLCYYVDSDKNAFCGNVTLSAKIETANSSIKINNINRVCGKNSGVTMFCNNYAQSRSTNSDDIEILLSLVGADKVGTNGDFKCKVESVMTGSGHSFKDNQIILNIQKGTDQGLAELAVDTEVILHISCVDAAGKAISIMQSSTPMSGYGVRNGQPQTSSVTNYPQCAVGVSQDGKTAYWFDLEYGAKSNAPIRMLNEYMAAVGAWNAVLLDGGPSAEMSVFGEWATTNSVGAGGNGRNVPCGLIAYSNAPSDNTLANVEFKAVKTTVVNGTTYTPRFYGFNKYGEQITDQAENNSEVYLTCDASIGKITADGKSFVPTENKSGYIYGHVNGVDAVAKMWVDVQSGLSVSVEPKFVFTEKNRGLYANLYINLEDGSRELVAKENVTWKATNKWVCDVDKDGYLYPNQDNQGEDAYIVAEYLGLSDSITVIVENNPEKDEVNFAENVKDIDNIDLTLPSIPTSFYVNLAVDDKMPSSATVIYKKGKQQCEAEMQIPESLSESLSLIVPLDNTVFEDYPVTIEKILVTGGSLRLKALSALYRGAEPSVSVDPENPENPDDPEDPTEPEITVSSVRIEPKTLFTESGRGLTAMLYATMSDGVEEQVPAANVVWVSTDKAVCAVDDKGNVTPKQDSKNDVYIIAEYCELKDTLVVTVQDNPEEDELQLASLVDNISDINIVLPSIPTSFYVRLAVDGDMPSAATIIYKKGERQCEEKIQIPNDQSAFLSAIVTLDPFVFEDYPVTIEKILVDGGNVTLDALSALYRGAEPKKDDPETAIVNIKAAEKVKILRQGDNIMLDMSAVKSADGSVEYSVWSLKGDRITANMKGVPSNTPVTIANVRTGGMIVVVKVDNNKYVYKIK